MVTQLTMPWTSEGKDLAILKALEGNYERYFTIAATQRSYFPHNVPERFELQKYANLWKTLSRKIRRTVLQLFKGFLAVESFVDDYVFAGVRAARNRLTIIKNTQQWGFEEKRHGDMFRICIIDAGMMTQAAVDRFLDECRKDTWTFERQTGMEATAGNSSAYTIVQERHTRFNYTKFRKYLMEMFAQTGNKLLEILARLVRYVEIDEGAHEGNFRSIARIYQKYRPDTFITALRIAAERYKMPAVVYPEQDEFEQTIIATKIFSAMEFGREIFAPALRGMGFKNRNAIKRAEEGVRNLPINAVVQIQGKADWTEIEEGLEPFEMSDEGIFVPVSLAA